MCFSLFTIRDLAVLWKTVSIKHDFSFMLHHLKCPNRTQAKESVYCLLYETEATHVKPEKTDSREKCCSHASNYPWREHVRLCHCLYKSSLCKWVNVCGQLLSCEMFMLLLWETELGLTVVNILSWPCVTSVEWLFDCEQLDKSYLNMWP